MREFAKVFMPAFVLAFAAAGGAVSAAEGDGADERPNRFDAMARELLAGIASRGGAEPVRIAVVPFDPEETPGDTRRAEEIAAALEAALTQAAAGAGVRVKARTHLARVFSEMWNSGFDEDRRSRARLMLREANAFDVMVVGRLDHGADGGRWVRFQAIELDGGDSLATSESALESAPSTASDDAQRAVSRAARKLVDAVPVVSILSTAGMRYRDTGHRTQFGDLFEFWLAEKMQDLARDPLKNPNPVVRPLTLGEERLRELHGRSLPDWSGALSAHPPLDPGHYVLSGRYRVGPDAIRYDVGLYTRAGRVASARGRVSRRDEEIAGLRVRPDEDFGFLTETDGRDAFRFGLTSNKDGRSPKYAIGESIHLVLHSEIDAWISCYHWGRGENGRYALTRILPNEHMRDGGRVDGGHGYTVPGLDSFARPDDPWPFVWTAGGPPSEDLVKCFAADRDVADLLPADLAGRTFAQLPDGAAERLSAAFHATGAKVAETSMVVTIVEGGGDDGA